MGNKPSHSKHNDYNEPWSLKFLVRIGVLVPDATAEGTATTRVIDNKVLHEQAPQVTMLGHSEQHKHSKTRCLVIPKDWQDHSEEFQERVNVINAKFDINWFHVALMYCRNNFDEQKTWEDCRKYGGLLPQRYMTPFDNDPHANPWYFMNKHLNDFDKVPSFAKHLTATKAASNQ